MTKPIVSIGIMQLVEDGELLLDDPLQKFIPEFANQSVGVVNDGKLDLVPLVRPITIQDLLRHTSGITYDHVGDGPMQKMYQQSQVRSRKISNEEHARLIAGMPLVCQPGAAWNYSRSTDILGRVIEVISGQTLGAFLTERILAPLQMAETAFHTGAEKPDRLAEPFADRSVDRRHGGAVQHAGEAGDGIRRRRAGLDHDGLCAVLPDAAERRHARRHPHHRPQDAAADDREPSRTRTSPPDNYILPPGHGFGLGFAVRTEPGIAPFAGSVGQFFWSGIAGTFFWVDPAEELFAVFMSQGPGQREYFRTLVRGLVYAAVE